LWVAKYFNEKLARKRLILSHHKHLLIGDYLIDDGRFNEVFEFKGEWLHFGTENFRNWGGNTKLFKDKNIIYTKNQMLNNLSASFTKGQVNSHSELRFFFRI